MVVNLKKIKKSHLLRFTHHSKVLSTNIKESIAQLMSIYVSDHEVCSENSPFFIILKIRSLKTN